MAEIQQVVGTSDHSVFNPLSLKESSVTAVNKMV